MTKKKKILNGIIFLVGLIVFAVYYFKDNTDLAKVEKKQDDSAKEAAKIMEEDLNASFDDGEQIESNKKVAADTDLEKVEKAQDKSANEAAETVLSADLKDFEVEQDSKAKVAADSAK
jgi:hypothetical protein